MGNVEIALTIEAVPPSVNHYVVHTRRGQHFKTREAERFEGWVFAAWHQAGRPRLATIPQRRKPQYEIEVTIYLGKGKRGDWDNFPKVLGDSLQRIGVIETDSAIKRGIVNVKRDWKRPRTEVVLKIMEGEKDRGKKS